MKYLLSRTKDLEFLIDYEIFELPEDIYYDPAKHKTELFYKLVDEFPGFMLLSNCIVNYITKNKIDWQHWELSNKKITIYDTYPLKTKIVEILYLINPNES